MLLSEAGVNPVHARPLFNAVQRKLLREGIASLDAILRPVRTWLAGGDAPEFCGIEEVDRTPSADGLTQKSAR